MPHPKHRLEIYLPLYYNPDPKRLKKRKPVEEEKFDRVEEEILTHFGELGYSWELISRKRTFGKYKGIVDELQVFKIDVYLTERDFQWIEERQRAWASKKYFDQEALYIVGYEVWVY